MEMAAVDNSFESLCHEGKSWNKIWFLKEYFSVGGRSLCSALKIQRAFSLSVLKEMPQKLLLLNLSTNLRMSRLLKPNLFVNKRASVNNFLSSNLKENLKHVRSPDQFGSVY